MAALGAKARDLVVQALFAAQFGEQLVTLAFVDPEAQLRGAASDYLLGLPAEHLAEAGVDLDEHAIADARHADGFRAGLEQGDELLLGGGHALLALHPFGDVEQDAGHAQGQSVGVAVQFGGAFQVTVFAVVQADAVGHLVFALRAIEYFPIGLAHLLLILLWHPAEELAELAMERFGGQAVQAGRTLRAVQRAAGYVPVPDAEVGRLQGQIEALLAFAQGLLLLLLFGDVADHAEDLRVAVGVGPRPAADFQPVQAAVGPADAMAQGFGNRLALQYLLKQLLHLGALFCGDQLDIVDLPLQGMLGVQAEQGLGAARPADPAAVDVPVPGTQVRAVERREQARRILPGLFELDRVQGGYMGEGRLLGWFGHRVSRPPLGTFRHQPEGAP